MVFFWPLLSFPYFPHPHDSFPSLSKKFCFFFSASQLFKTTRSLMFNISSAPQILHSLIFCQYLFFFIFHFPSTWHLVSQHLFWTSTTTAIYLLGLLSLVSLIYICHSWLWNRPDIWRALKKGERICTWISGLNRRLERLAWSWKRSSIFDWRWIFGFEQFWFLFLLLLLFFSIPTELVLMRGLMFTFCLMGQNRQTTSCDW